MPIPRGNYVVQRAPASVVDPLLALVASEMQAQGLVSAQSGSYLVRNVPLVHAPRKVLGGRRVFQRWRDLVGFVKFCA